MIIQFKTNTLNFTWKLTNIQIQKKQSLLNGAFCWQQLTVLSSSCSLWMISRCSWSQKVHNPIVSWQQKAWTNLHLKESCTHLLDTNWVNKLLATNTIVPEHPRTIRDLARLLNCEPYEPSFQAISTNWIQT